jgi:hypothetical protein
MNISLIRYFQTRKPVFWIITVFLMSVFSLIRCTQTLSQGGFGSETTNGKIVGSVILPDGSAASAARITIRKSNYVSAPQTAPAKRIAMTSGDGITDKNGLFSIDSLDTGSYVIEVNDTRANAVCGRFQITAESPSVNFGTQVLQQYSVITGEVGGSDSGVSKYVQVVGLERLAIIDTNGSYTLGDLPAGIFTLRIMTTTTNTPVLIDNIQANAGTVTTAPVIQWPHSKKLVLNTSATGAGITGNVYGFPVLVRLTKSDFLFSEAEKDGKDIRFSKTSGAMLPYEIEHWDSTNGNAAIWVTVDTILGSNDSQSIVMLWGSPHAQDKANHSAAFDTANGFKAVWHLDNSCDDATFNVHNGTTCGASDTAGMIGYCKKFGGSDSIRIQGLLNQPSVVTLSAWVRSDTVRDIGGEIISIGDGVLMRIDDKQTGTATVGAIHTYGDSTNPTFFNVSSNRTLTKTGWHYIAFIADDVQANQSLYIDGALVQHTINKNAKIEYVGLGHNTYIGHHANKKSSYNFTGLIDEVRICGVARSADWVKLSFMNQKPDDVLVKFVTISQNK